MVLAYAGGLQVPSRNHFIAQYRPSGVNLSTVCPQCLEGYAYASSYYESKRREINRLHDVEVNI